MKKQEKPINALEQFLPTNSFPLVAPFFQTHVIHLTLTRERKSVLGDYRAPTPAIKYHRISLNVNLNPYSFLITLLHELAHLQTFNLYQHKASPHGQEWKAQFRDILIPFIGKGFFPVDVEKALMAYIRNPAASTCTDPNLFKALYRYDDHKPGSKLADELKVGERFTIEDGRLFEKIETMRTRVRCREVKTNKVYFLPGIYEVQSVHAV